MTTFKAMGLRTRFSWLIILVVTPVLALVIFSAHEQQELRRDDVISHAVDTARDIAEQKTKIIERAEELLMTLSRLPVLREKDGPGCSALFSDLLPRYPQYLNLVAADIDGFVFCSARPLSGPLNVKDELSFSRALEERGLAMGELSISRINQRPYIGEGYPVLDDTGQVVAILGTILSVDWINQEFARRELPQNSVLTLFDQSGTVIARRPDTAQWVGKSIAASALFAATMRGEDSLDTDETDGIRRIYGLAKVRNSPSPSAYYVTVGLAADQAFELTYLALWRYVFLLLLVTAAALIIGRYGVNFLVTNPISNLAATSEKIAAGDLQTRADLSGNPPEIQKLSKQFNHMLDALAESDLQRERLREVIEQTGDLVYISAPDGTLNYLNNAAQQALSLQQGEDLSLINNTQHLYAPRIWTALQDKTPISSTGPEIFDLEGPDGRSTPYSQMLFPLRGSGGNDDGYAVISRDISEHQKEADRFQALGNSFPGGIAYHDTTEHCVFINSRYAKWIGDDPNNLIGLGICDFVGSETYSEIKPFLGQVLQGENVVFERTSYLPSLDKRQVLISYLPDFDAAGEIQGFFTLITDVTDIKNTEQALRLSQKMDVVGQLSSGISHDFNNILAIILGNVELLELQVANDEKAAQMLGEIQKSAQRAVVLTGKLLRFARSDTREAAVTNINELILESENLIARTVTPAVNIERKIADDLWPAFVNPGELEDSLLNLVLNARDAMPNGGTLTLEACNVTLDQDYCNLNTGAVPGEYVEIAVSDNGKGIPRELLEHLYEPFFTTKERGKGTGLGLAMVYGFAMRSGGSVKVYSEVGIGTTFKIYLPRANEEADSTVTSRQRIAKRPTGSETLLVVDDEEQLRELAKLKLEQLGYRVFTACDGNEALSVLASEPSIELLFSDVVMPGGVNGYQLAERAVAEKPELKVVLTSGYTETAVEHTSQAALNKHFLSKPYTLDELAREMRHALDE